MTDRTDDLSTDRTDDPSTADGRFGDAARLAGATGAALTLAAIVVATAVSPAFSWTESALSDLGVAPETALLFNGGLILGGVVALGYAAALRRSSRAVAVAYAACALSMVGVGVFPSDTALHLPAALSFFVLLAVTLGLDGARRRSTRTGRASLVLAAVSVAAWPLWFLSDVGSGIAVPEFAGALSLAAWVVALAPPAPVRAWSSGTGRLTRRRR